MQIVRTKRKLLSLFFATAMLSTGLLATSFDQALAQAQPVLLTPAQVADIQGQVTAAINAASMQQFNVMLMDPAVVQLCNCSKPTPDQISTTQCDNPGRLAALTQAIANVTISLIGQYGPQTAGDVTSIILATAGAQGVPAGAIGTGLGRAATQIAISNNAAAILIAQDLAAEGTADIDNCFANADPVLAAVVTEPPTVGAPPTNPPDPPQAPPPINPVLATTPS